MCRRQLYFRLGRRFCSCLQVFCCLWLLGPSLPLAHAQRLSDEALAELDFSFELDQALERPHSIYKLGWNPAEDSLGRFAEHILLFSQLQELQLEDLSLARPAQLQALWQALPKLPALRILHLSENDLSECPAALFALSGLERLHLGGNQLRQLPDSLDRWPRLRELQLQGNLLTRLPPSLARLHALEVLNLGRNNLLELPATLAALQRLEVLDLSANTFPEASLARFPWGELSALRELHLAYLNLQVVPHTLTQLRGLQALHLSYNPLVDLPAALLALPYLSLVELSGTQVPEALRQGYRRGKPGLQLRLGP